MANLTTAGTNVPQAKEPRENQDAGSVMAWETKVTIMQNTFVTEEAQKNTRDKERQA
jgi:hypothetical protein